jgi:hypothetical protein
MRDGCAIAFYRADVSLTIKLKVFTVVHNYITTRLVNQWFHSRIPVLEKQLLIARTDFIDLMINFMQYPSYICLVRLA